VTTVPERPSLDGLEEKWDAQWERDGVYRFPHDAPREQVYSIDTPPPTVSGSLHVGHVFSYTHTDLMARFFRMRGRAVFYPMGWDDNGLPTERRVQNYYGVRCVPSVPYDPDFEVPAHPPADGPPQEISRRNFVDLCFRLTQEDEVVFEDMWRRLGLSVDWSHTYTTIGEQSQRASQSDFLSLVRRGIAYTSEAPTLWDVDFQSAVAQAELEDRETPGVAYRIRFEGEDGGEPVVIETTRPELLPACVAVLVHPDDDRYRDLVGARLLTPLFKAPVPVLSHPLVEREKGTGVVMTCTFGDVTDVTWWRELSLPMRAVVSRDGRLLPVEWGTPGWESADPDAANAVYAELSGKRVAGARQAIDGILKDKGDVLVGEPQKLKRPVKYFEKGDRPIEIVTSRQWFVNVTDHREALAARGHEIEWHPPYLRARLIDWIDGLLGDWAISRQRFFGVPFPVWYPIGQAGNVDREAPIFPDEESLPVDPQSDTPPGYTADQRDQPGGFTGDADVMDTWATSSLSPQIAGRKLEDPELFDRLFPFDLRPQAHDIIRTWLFSTLVRSHFTEDAAPWRNAAISGWVLDPDRKKMSKSKGNVVTPIDWLNEYGADGVRYWAARGRPGVDTAFEPQQMKIGRRLAVKLLNASKFVLSDLPEPGAITHPLDQAMMRRVADVVADATRQFENYDYTRALERTEHAFWWFCDYYVELIKERRYGDPTGEGARSASAALRTALDTFLRLFAPFLPFTTEEVWSWWREGSVHTAAWPSADEVLALIDDGAGDEQVLDVAGAVLGAVRKLKSEAKLSMAAEVPSVTVRDTAQRLALLTLVDADVRSAGRVAELVATEADEFSVELTNAPA
jgi:valyl-tRNA synthetase